MRSVLIFACVLFVFVGESMGAFVNGRIGDSRLQTENSIYEPGGIVGLGLEFGVFDEVENMLDYTLSIGISRTGYSHSDGEVSVSFWYYYLKPFAWSFTFKNFMLGWDMGFGLIFSTSNVNKRLEDEIFDPVNNGFADGFIRPRAILINDFKLGYRINEQFAVSLVYNYVEVAKSWYIEGCSNSHKELRMGGVGVNFLWNIPWIPF